MNRRHVFRAISGMAGGLWLVPGAAPAGQDQPVMELQAEPLPVPAETEIRTLELPSPSAVALSADGSLIAAGGNDGIVRLGDAVSGRSLSAFRGHEFRIDVITLSPDRTRIAIGGPEWAGFLAGGIGETFQEMGAVIKVWNVATERLLDSLSCEERVPELAFSPDGDRVLFVSRTGLTIRNIETRPDVPGRMRELVEVEMADWSCGGKVSFSADARRAVATCGRRAPKGIEPTLRLWDVPTQRIRTLENLKDWIGESFGPIALSPDGMHIAISSVGFPLVDDRDASDEDRHPLGIPAVDEPPRRPTRERREPRRLVTVLDFDSGKVVSQFRARLETVSDLHYLAFSPDGAWIVSANEDSSPTSRDVILRLWHARTGHELQAYRGPRGHVRAAAFLPDGRVRVVSGGDTLADKTGRMVGTDPLKVWEAEIPRP